MARNVYVGIQQAEAVKRIAQAAASGRLVLFIGAGVSRNSGLPGWRELLEPAAQKLGGWDACSGYSLPALAEAFEGESCRAELLDLVIGPLRKAYAPSEAHRLLPALRPRQVFTTNYDRLLEAVFTPPVPCIASPGNAARAKDEQLAIFHIHGHIDHLGETADGLVITESDYRDVAKTKCAFLERLKPHWQDSLILFLGYGAGDDDIKAQAHAVRDVFGESYSPRHLAIDLSGQTSAAFLRAQWSPLQADVLIGRDLPGHTPGERLLALLRASAEAVAREVAAAESVRRQSELGRTGIVAEVGAKVEQFTGSPWSFQPPSRIPPDLPDFTGRVSLIDQLEARLLSADANDTGIWGVHGMGGVGKSAIAERVANRLQRRNAFPDGYLWIKVGERNLAEVLVECWREIGGPVQGAEGMSLEQLQLTLRRVWRGRRMLVVLDNCDRAEQLGELLQAFNGHKLLVTTRVASDRVGWFPVECFDRTDALAMLRTICPRLNAESDDALAELAITRFGGLPLALRLAGSWLNFSARRTLKEYLGLLHQVGLGLLRRRPAAPSGLDEARADDIRACFSLSTQALTVEQLEAFKLLAMTGVDLPLEVACDWFKRASPLWTDATCHEAVDALNAAALLEVGGDGRLRMHALLRDHGRELLLANPIGDIDAGEFALLVLHAVTTAPAGANGLPWACNEAVLVDAAIQVAWWGGATQSALKLLDHVARDPWVQHGPLLPIQRLASLMLSKPERLNDAQRLRALIIRGDIHARLNADAEVVQDLLDAQRLALALGEDSELIRSFYLLRHHQSPEAWVRMLRSISRLARSKRLRPWDVQHLTCNLLNWVGYDNAGVVRLNVDQSIHHESNYNALIAMEDAVCIRDVSVATTKAGLCKQAWDWATQLRVLWPRLSLASSIAEHAAHRGDLDAAALALRLGYEDTADQRTVAMEADHMLSCAWLNVHRGNPSHLKEAITTLGVLEKDGVALSRHGRLLRALLACEAELRLAVLNGCLSAWDSAGLRRLVAQAQAEMRLELLLWSVLLDVASILLNNLSKPEQLDRAHRLSSRVWATLRQSPTVNRLHIDRVLQWLDRAGSRLPDEVPDAPPFDVRPAWWRAADKLPPRITLGDGTPMVLIPPGSYAIARTPISNPDTAERPAHVPPPLWEAWQGLARQMPPPAVWLPGFYIDIHPVTWRQYLAYCSATGSTPAVEPPGAEYNQRPVTGLTHEEATAYAAWAGKRLPIADEWRAALCGKAGRRFPWGNQIGDVTFDAEFPLPLPDMRVHPLTTFDEARFTELLRGSLSLSISEKLRVAHAVPTLSQFQIDELFKVFEDELVEFEKLKPTEGDIIHRMGRIKEAQQLFVSGVAPRDVMAMPADVTAEGVYDLVGGVREWIEESPVQVAEDASPSFMVMGLLPSQPLLEDFDPMSLPEVVHGLYATAKRRADATIGFRCVIPLIDGMELPPELQQIYNAAESNSVDA
jgi:formylglycine-generating enzyme required for sulfatase activity